MRGSPLSWATLQVTVLLTFSLTALTSLSTVQSRDCGSHLLISSCNPYVFSQCFESYKWVTTQDWMCECSCLLEQKLTAESNHVFESQRVPKPTLHCRDDRTISVTWSEDPYNFDPPFNKNLIYFVELRKLGDSVWTPSVVTNRLVSVAENLQADTNYRFRVHMIRPGFHKVSLAGQDIRTFRPLTNQSTETLSPTQEVWQTLPFTFYNDSTASTRIRWKPGQERTCWFHVIIATSNHEGPIRHKGLFIGEKPMETEIAGLKVGVRYNLTVSSLERNFSHSNQIPHDASCEVFPVNLTISGPPAPKLNVSHVTVSQTSNGISRVDIAVSWDDIPGGPPSNVTVLVESEVSGRVGPIVVNGDEHSVTIRDVLVRKTYNVTVFASSPGGQGEHANWWDQVETVENGGVATVILVVLLSISVPCGAIFFVRKLYNSKHRRSDIRAKFSQLELLTAFRVDEWEIPRETLVIEEEIGRGAFGTVHRAYLSKPAGFMEVAVKKLRPEPTSDDARQFRLEAEIMKGVDKHPNVLSLLGCVTRPEPGLPLELLLVVEYCALGDLQGFLRKAWKRMAEQSSPTNYVSVDARCVQYAQLMAHSESTSGSTCESIESGDEHLDEKPNASRPFAVSNQTYGLYLGMVGGGGIQRQGTRKHWLGSDYEVTPADLLSFARQVAMGMEFLSASRVVHRDLAARNVLVCADRSVKISDFGLSRDIYEQNIYRKAGVEKIPVKWMAIESLMHQVYTTQSDVWSFGILVYEIATLGGSPYPSVSNDALFQLLNSGYRMERPPTCGTELYRLMRDCWDADPSKRPTFSSLKRRLDALLEAAAPHHYIQIDQLFSPNKDILP